MSAGPPPAPRRWSTPSCGAATAGYDALLGSMMLIPFAFWAPLYTIVSGDSLRDMLHPMYILRILIDGGGGSS